MSLKSTSASNKNWFNTLAEALQAENLEDTWELHFSPINYGCTFAYTYDDGSKHGRYVSIYRSEQGLYERPVTYRR